MRCMKMKSKSSMNRFLVRNGHVSKITLIISLFTFEFSGFKQSQVKALLKEHPALRCTKKFDLEDVKESADFLLRENFTRNDIKERPLTLLINKLTIQNRKEIFQECSFNEPFQLLLYAKFVTILNKQVNILRAYNYFPQDIDMVERLCSFLDAPIDKSNFSNIDEIPLGSVREMIIGEYLKSRLALKQVDVNKIFEVYSRLKNKSLNNLVRNIDLLENNFKLSHEKIISNGFVLHAEPDNMLKILEIVPTIGDEPIRDIIMKRAKLLMTKAESMRKIIDEIVSFGIDEKGILRCLEILTLGPDTVFNRLAQLTAVKEFEVLKSNPRILRLIHYQRKAKSRLDYLKQLKINCISLHVLSSASTTFEKYAREGVDKSKGCDLVTYLAQFFTTKENDVRKVLLKNPHWCHVPSLKAKQCIEFLVYKNFTHQEIFENLLICLYPQPKIESKLNALIEWRKENTNVYGINLNKISNKQLLSLCLYFIEAEFHFSGDGIWDVTKPESKIDFTSQSLPELPTDLMKDYRYGKKSNVGVSSL